MLISDWLGELLETKIERFAMLKTVEESQDVICFSIAECTAAEEGSHIVSDG